MRLPDLMDRIDATNQHMHEVRARVEPGHDTADHWKDCIDCELLDIGAETARRRASDCD